MDNTNNMACAIEPADSTIKRILLADVSNDKDPYVNTIHGVRGDGFCSLWSVIIGYCINIATVSFNELPFIEQREVKTIVDVIIVLRDICDFILKAPQILVEVILNDINGECEHPLEMWELNQLFEQLNQPISYINTIHGDAHFKILAYILKISISILNEPERHTYIIGNFSMPNVYIKTDGSHYSLFVSQESLDNYEELECHWWADQWKNHPLTTEENTFTVFIPKLLKQ